MNISSRMYKVVCFITQDWYQIPVKYPAKYWPVWLVAFGGATGSGSGSVTLITSSVKLRLLASSPVCDFSTTSEVIFCKSSTDDSTRYVKKKKNVCEIKKNCY